MTMSSTRFGPTSTTRAPPSPRRKLRAGLDRAAAGAAGRCLILKPGRVADDPATWSAPARGELVQRLDPDREADRPVDLQNAAPSGTSSWTSVRRNRSDAVRGDAFAKSALFALQAVGFTFLRGKLIAGSPPPRAFGCWEPYTENMGHDREVEGIEIINPFC